MTKSKPAQPIDPSVLRSRLKLRDLQSENVLRSRHPQAVNQLEAAGIRPGSLRAHAARLLTAGAAATTLMVSAPPLSFNHAALPATSTQSWASPVDFRDRLQKSLSSILPTQVQPLTSNQEQQITQLLHQTLGIHAAAQLEGNRLNTPYGYIGQEQHLPRYPGDTIANHDELREYGLTPGRGAWGYFTQSAGKLSDQEIQMEKYYVAVQTLYLPDWSTRFSYLRDWYRFRKVVVVNPKNGRSIVAVIADSGPGASTGKQFGGSPEVMNYLRSKDGRQKGPVVLFFIDDPDNKVPLGPLEYNLEQGPPLLMNS